MERGAARQKPLQVHEAGDDAEWRRCHWNTQKFLEPLRWIGKPISPIFFVFGVFTCLFRVDWLHAVDKGVGQDFLGNLFALFVQVLPGATKKERTQVLWKHIQAYYKEYHIKEQMSDFDYSKIQSEKKVPPTLKTHAAAHTRALINFGHLEAQELLSDDVPHHLAAKTAARALRQCYQCLSKTCGPFRDQVFRESSKTFALYYHALFMYYGGNVKWRVMPKMHLFLELCNEGSEPNLFWCYRDEDFGGSVAKSSKMRGMWKKLTSFCGHGLDMFFMKNDPPRLIVSC